MVSHELPERKFVKHTVTGVLAVMEWWPGDGEIVGGCEVTDPTACVHQLSTYACTEAAVEVLAFESEARYWEDFEPKCTNIGHGMQDIRVADEELAKAEKVLSAIETERKKAKVAVDEKLTALRSIITKYRAEPKLPLYDEPSQASGF